MPEVVRQIGALAGLAAILGLAVLSVVYVVHARAVGRLRRWAGRAPERDRLRRSRRRRSASRARR
jgi:hypothetical protein